MAAQKSRLLRREFWSDLDVLRWSAVKRLFYVGLCAVADDSGCLERDAFSWKCQLFASPVDGEITVERIETWCDELIEAGKLVPYTVGGKSLLFMPSFRHHQKPSHPLPPVVPLPTWITVEDTGTQREHWKYTTDEDLLQEYLAALSQGSASPESEQATVEVNRVEVSKGQVGSGHGHQRRGGVGSGEGSACEPPRDPSSDPQADPPEGRKETDDLLGTLSPEQRREIEELAEGLDAPTVERALQDARAEAGNGSPLFPAMRFHLKAAAEQVAS